MLFVRCARKTTPIFSAELDNRKENPLTKLDDPHLDGSAGVVRIDALHHALALPV